MKLFPRIFATFCAVIVCAIFVASSSFWLVQNTLAETRFKQQRNFEENLLSSTMNAFQARGDAGIREQLVEWGNSPGGENLYVITGDNKNDILGRPIDPEDIDKAHEFALSHPHSKLVQIAYNSLGEEYLFMIRGWNHERTPRPPSPFFIPGLPIAPVWHEFIILSFIIVVGLLTAYILANNITQPIRVLWRGMDRLAHGNLQTRVSHQLSERRDELYSLAVQFDNMADKLQKLVEKERHLLHHVSHEMRSPLARMQAIIGLIHVQPQKQEQHLQRLESELGRMDLLVGELLTLSRLETSDLPITLEPLSLVPLIKQIMEDNQAIAMQHQQTLSWQCDIPDTAMVKANESYLYRAFDNVVRNAINYSPDGSEIKVYLHEGGKQQWQVDISDNGPGVAENQLPHIFTAFYRADSSANKPGTGLGLALTKHIIDRHHGKIYADNQQPKGLSMHFLLPKFTPSRNRNRQKNKNQLPVANG
ncbi:two-component sensor histidine kinase [Snodgrassella alvi]|uniref:sensor histidine kinase n=1 Tax=Snodgrassella alvi TaxID=1196083 RepID=UPI000A00CEE7|nr:HAMP domain-containing sensor histidine kinase [Snodgrassella alvi]ORF06308.1 two-component sensor histidine kinase [Snodgrassella alvi]ORF14383.1 two-component sensor histidine kinase [Snodgrassella alvi]ORF19209.1 two-component sensor histidine kinase [Snodgrassella alvi]ORF19265.1 two-component sensor histidine kinase [Snodgrassella alvi]